MALLNVKDLCVNYGNIKALKGISFSVEEGQIVTLIGSNGAGKSTTMNAVSGLVKIASGSILFDGEEIAGMASDKIVKKGIIMAPEGRQVFPEMTTGENLAMGAFTCKDKVKISQNLEMVYNLFPILKEREKQIAGTLSGGEQQMLAVGRALMGDPKLLMLDEPSLGLAPQIIQEIFKLIQRINKEKKLTVLLVEQNARMALSISDQAFVLETGKVVLSGTGQEVMNDERTRVAYLGGRKER